MYLGTVGYSYIFQHTCSTSVGILLGFKVPHGKNTPQEYFNAIDLKLLIRNLQSPKIIFKK